VPLRRRAPSGAPARDYSPGPRSLPESQT
jgi:hypothetical protein